MSLSLVALRQTVDASLAPARAVAAKASGAGGGSGGGAAGGGSGGGGGGGGELAPIPNPARAVLEVVTAVTSVMSMPMELMNTGVALATNALAAVLPSFPAAHLGSLYVGAPHAHSHPPSLIPPAPPVPLPSIGAITLGTCVKVLVGGMPAARAGDLGMAPTCGGIAPFFTVKLGSSKVFINGARAARMTDMCTACTTDMGRSMGKLDIGMAALGIAADATDALDPAASAAQAAASAMAAAMGAAQLAADAVAMALSKTMGTDPAIPPALPGFVMLGMPTVLVAGVPMPNLPDPTQWLKNKLKAAAKKMGGKALAKLSKALGGGGGCK
jgi:uncharacterized Zn-binding protein involved in type VI secretion